MKFTPIRLSAIRIVAGLTSLAAALAQNAVRLDPNSSIQDELTGGDVRSYVVTLSSGQSLQASLTPSSAGMRIVTRLNSHDGKALMEENGSDFNGGGAIPICLIAETAGDYKIEIAAAEGSIRGRYDLRVENIRTATNQDRKRCQAIHTFGLGQDQLRANRFDQAIELYKRGLILSREAADRSIEGFILHNFGNAYNNLRQYDKAIDFYNRALVIRRELKDWRREAASLTNLAGVYLTLHQPSKAISCYEETLAIDRANKDRFFEALSLNRLGFVYKRMTQYGRAMGYFEQALVIDIEIQSRAGEAAVRQQMGWIYHLLGQTNKAIPFMERSLAFYRETGNRRGETSVLADLGLALSSIRQYDRAFNVLQQALTIDREGKNLADESRDLDALGLANLRRGKPDLAIESFERSIEIARGLKGRTEIGYPLDNLGRSYLDLRQYEKAVRPFSEALAVARSVQDRRLEGYALHGLMAASASLGQPRLSIFYGKQAVNTIQSIRTGISALSRDLQQSFIQFNRGPYHKLADVLISQGRLTEAEQVLGLLKQEEYFEFLRRDSSAASPADRAIALTPEEAEWEKRYLAAAVRLVSSGTEHGELLAKGSLTTEESRRLEQLEQDLTAGNREFERFLADLARNFSAKPAAHAAVELLRESRGIMEDLRELPEGTVAIYTFVGDDKFHAIMVTPDVQKAYEYPIGADDLNRKVFAFRRVIQDPDLDPRPSAQELYKILIANMADDLKKAKARTLMFALDGTLRYLPVAALFDGNHYLLEDFRVAVYTPASNARLKDRPDSRWKAVGFGVTKAHEGEPALPEVTRELNGIIAKPGGAGVLEGEIRLDDDFTERQMRETLRKRYPVVHIASHFQFHPGDETHSFLLLGDGRHLSIADLKNMPNLFGGVQLLTLSACNTGVGDSSGNGTEVEGLGVLAQRQGAKAVIASLWPVADVSTSLLMQEFYRIRGSSAGMTKVEALQQAQLALMRMRPATPKASDKDRGVVPAHTGSANAPLFKRDASAPYQHPFFWAPFFLMGNWL